jgi:ribosome-binding factor A
MEEAEMNRRMARLNGLFQEELADLIRDLQDPRLAPIISVTSVDISPDLESGMVKISVLGEAEEKRDTIAALTHAAPHLRRELLHRIRIRHIPTLHFSLDETIEEAAHVLELMRKVSPGPADKPE